MTGREVGMSWVMGWRGRCRSRLELFTGLCYGRVGKIIEWNELTAPHS